MLAVNRFWNRLYCGIFTMLSVLCRKRIRFGVAKADGADMLGELGISDDGGGTISISQLLKARIISLSDTLQTGLSTPPAVYLLVQLKDSWDRHLDLQNLLGEFEGGLMKIAITGQKQGSDQIR